MMQKDRRYKTNPDERRTQRLQVLLTIHEMERLLRVADKEGITLSRLVRRQLNIKD